MSDIDEVLNPSYYSQTAKKIDLLGQSGMVTKGKKVFLKSYLDKTQFAQMDFKAGGYTPWSQQLLNDRVNLLNSLLGDFMGTQGAGKPEVPTGNYYLKMQGMIAGAAKTGALKPMEKHYMGQYLGQIRLLQNHFSRKGSTSFGRQMLFYKMKQFDTLFTQYMKGGGKPGTRARVKRTVSRKPPQGDVTGA